MGYFLRSLRSLRLHRLRSLLSTLGILFGVTAVLTMLAIAEGAKNETLEQIEQLGTTTLIIRQNLLSKAQEIQAKENSSQGLSEEDAYRLKTLLPNLIAMAPIKAIKASLPGSLHNMAPEILAVSKDYQAIKNLQLKEGRFICDHDQKAKQLVCVIGADVAKTLGFLGRSGAFLQIEDFLLKIVGVLEENQWKSNKNAFLATKNINQLIFIPLGIESLFPFSLNHENTKLSEILLKFKRDKDLTRLSEIAHHILENTHGTYQDYQIIIPQELLKQANQTHRTFNLVLGSIAAISLLVGGIGIMNMMLANVSERIREIGIRRALGAKRLDILMQFLSEVLLLTLIGASLGIVFGGIFSFGIAYFAGWKTIITIWSLFLSIGMAVLVGLCSGIYPAYQAAMLHPLVALRRE